MSNNSKCLPMHDTSNTTTTTISNEQLVFFKQQNRIECLTNEANEPKNATPAHINDTVIGESWMAWPAA